MQKTVLSQENLDVKEAMVDKLIVENGEVRGVQLETGEQITSKTVILTTGTYMHQKS